MSKKEGGPAFPVNEGRSILSSGMTMRQYYKAAALTGFMGGISNLDSDQPSWDDLAGIAGGIADAMLAEDEEATE